jgi:hypothetical protein
MELELLYKKIYVFARLSRESFVTKNSNLANQLDQIIRHLDKYSNIFIPLGISSKCSCNEADIKEGLERLITSLPQNNTLKKLMNVNQRHPTPPPPPHRNNLPTIHGNIVPGSVTSNSSLFNKYIGIRNVSNTCYANSFMQVFLGCKDIIRIIFRYNGSSIILKNFQDFLTRYYNGEINNDRKYIQHFWINAFKPELYDISTGFFIDEHNGFIPDNINTSLVVKGKRGYFNNITNSSVNTTTTGRFILKYKNKNNQSQNKTYGSRNSLENGVIKNTSGNIVKLKVGESPFQQQELTELYVKFIDNIIDSDNSIKLPITNLLNIGVLTKTYYNVSQTNTDETNSTKIRYKTNYNNGKFDMYLDLKISDLNVPGDIKMETLFNRFFNPAIIDLPDRLESKNRSSKNILGLYPFKVIPSLCLTSQYFSILINRMHTNQINKYNNNITNIWMNPIFYVEELNKDIYINSINMESQVYNFTNKKKIYKLIGFSKHIGNSMMAGHWIGYRLVNNSWIKFDDATTKNITKNNTEFINDLQQSSFLLYEFVREELMTSEEISKLNTVEESNEYQPLLLPNQNAKKTPDKPQKWKFGKEHGNILDAVREYYTKISPNSRPSNGSWNINSLNGINTRGLTEGYIAEVIHKHIFIKQSDSEEVILYSPTENPPNCTVCNSVFILINDNGTFSIMIPNDGYEFKNNVTINKERINLDSLLKSK